MQGTAFFQWWNISSSHVKDIGQQTAVQNFGPYFQHAAPPTILFFRWCATLDCNYIILCPPIVLCAADDFWCRGCLEWRRGTCAKDRRYSKVEKIAEISLCQGQAQEAGHPQFCAEACRWSPSTVQEVVQTVQLQKTNLLQPILGRDQISAVHAISGSLVQPRKAWPGPDCFLVAKQLHSVFWLSWAIDSFCPA